MTYLKNHCYPATVIEIFHTSVRSQTQSLILSEKFVFGPLSSASHWRFVSGDLFWHGNVNFLCIFIFFWFFCRHRTNKIVDGVRINRRWIYLALAQIHFCLIFMCACTANLRVIVYEHEAPATITRNSLTNFVLLFGWQSIKISFL